MMNGILKRLAVTSGVLAGVLSFTMSVRGNADLVLDDQNAEKTDASEERETLRKVVRKTQEVETTQEIVADPVEVTGQREESTMAPAMKSELVRRKRMREEMKNEDLLQQRLEELRLRDEEKRTKKVLRNTGLEEEDSEEVEAKKASDKKAAAALKKASEAELELEEEIVAAPANEPKMVPVYQMSPAPAGGAGLSDQVRYQQSSAAPAYLTVPPAPTGAQSVAVTDATKPADKKYGMSITPRFGFTSIGNRDFQFSPRFSAGVGLGFDVSENVGIEFGYTYSEVGIRNQNTLYNTNFGTGDELNYKQNIFDAGMKLYFLDTSSKIRPYVGAGMGYSMGYINYSDRIQQINRLYGFNTTDYELKSFIGMISAGLDLKVADKVSIGGSFKYLRPLSSSEGDALNTGYFYPQSYDSTRDYIRSSLRDSSISVFQLGATFQF
jgi:opacity protein-like surface antigen